MKTSDALVLSNHGTIHSLYNVGVLARASK